MWRQLCINIAFIRLYFSCIMHFKCKILVFFVVGSGTATGRSSIRLCNPVAQATHLHYVSQRDRFSHNLEHENNFCGNLEGQSQMTYVNSAKTSISFMQVILSNLFFLATIESLFYVIFTIFSFVVYWASTSYNWLNDTLALSEEFGLLGNYE